MSIKAVVFDMDGLMFDTERLYLEGYEYAGKKKGIQFSREELLRNLTGKTIKAGGAFFEKNYGKLCSYEECMELRQRYVDRVIREKGIPVKDGLFELIHYLIERGLRIALATSSTRERAEFYLRSAGLEDVFDTGVYGDMVSKSKPDPEIFETVAGELSLACAECLVLEDSYNGVMAAAAAGCPVIMVPDMLPATVEMQGLATEVLPSLAEVKEYVGRETGIYGIDSKGYTGEANDKVSSKPGGAMSAASKRESLME